MAAARAWLPRRAFPGGAPGRCADSGLALRKWPCERVAPLSVCGSAPHGLGCDACARAAATAALPRRASCATSAGLTKGSAQRRATARPPARRRPPAERWVRARPERPRWRSAARRGAASSNSNTIADGAAAGAGAATGAGGSGAAGSGPPPPPPRPSVLPRSAAPCRAPLGFTARGAPPTTRPSRTASCRRCSGRRAKARPARRR